MKLLHDHRGFTTGDSPNGTAAKQIVAKILELRNQGTAITDAQILADNPEIADELKHELYIAEKIREAMHAAITAAKPLPMSLLVDIGSNSNSSAYSVDSADVAVDNGAIESPLPQVAGYQLIKEIGRGGQAAVFDAIQESTKRHVAIKVMSGGPFATSRNRARFDREARILASLDHPNIVSILDRGRTADGSFFVVLYFINGIPLDEYWTSKINHDADGLHDLIRLYVKIAHAIHEAHQRGVIHRDLKPSNILVDARGEPHILDFGLATPSQELSETAVLSVTAPGQIIGSLPWASPEQAAGQSKKLNAISDVYSIGVLMYQALGGVFPYNLQGPIDEVLKRIRTYRPAPPSKQETSWPGINAILNGICLQALMKHPKNRYQSAKELGNDLQAWLDSEPVFARPRHANTRRHLTLTVMLLAFSAAAFFFIPFERTAAIPTVFQLPTIKSSAGIQLVEIPAGSFLMGSPESEPGHTAYEQLRRINIPEAFFFGITPVTQAQYWAVMHANPSDTRFLGPTFPVQNVSWENANEFCRRLGQIDHAHYRLPTDAEWEYACRANNSGPFPDSEHPERYAFTSENCGGMVHPVAQKLPNAWGLYDMQGNVAQWCSNPLYWHADDEVTKPIETLRIIRGGGVFENRLKCRAASRAQASKDSVRCDLGFRVLREP